MLTRMRTHSRPGPLSFALLALVTIGCEDKPAPPPVVSTPSLAPAAPEQKPAPEPTALDVSTAYPNTELIGAKARIHFSAAAESEAHTPPKAWRLKFDERGGFAGVCWKNRPGNEGGEPGDDLSDKGFRRISFWVRGAAGGEVVEFRAGGLGHHKTRYRDSFDVTAGKLTISSEWTEQTLYVSNADLSSVMTPFCVLLHREDNPNGAELFLDDVQYRG